MTINRNITYTNRDFSDLKQSLTDFSKTYFPNTYNDFSPSSTGMLFMEMASYVGDVLSFYLDNQIQETYLQYARQTENLFALAYTLGYSPKVTSVATTNIDVYQRVPSKLSGSVNIPDFNYAIIVPENTSVGSNIGTSNVNFLIQDKIDFSYSSSTDPTEISVYSISSGNPTEFLLKKTRKAISANINSINFSFGSPEEFPTITLNDANIISILDVFDSDGNQWYEVPNLAQETIYDTIKNTNTNDPNFSIDNEIPYLLKLKKVARRFATRFLSLSSLQIQFGSGTNEDVTENIVPNPNNVGLGLPYEQIKLTTAFSPTNFIFTNTYGIAPSNTTLTIRYLKGGGIESNVPANNINTIDKTNIIFINSNITGNTANYYFDSVRANNPSAADGGGGADSDEEIKQNALGTFQTQLRSVTQDDYLIRALSLPSRYGTIFKAYASVEKISNLNIGEVTPSLGLYILSQNSNNNLKYASLALKQNLKTYLSQYKIINDVIKIKDAFIINIGVDFDIITLPNFNNNEVLLNCVNALSGYFDINKWQINQPILLRDLYTLLDKIEGVQTVKNLNIYNKTGIANGYSDFAYDILGATINNIIYPSIDPMIFEVKFPQTDISGRVCSF
jgi:hypothetical protein